MWQLFRSVLRCSQGGKKITMPCRRRRRPFETQVVGLLLVRWAWSYVSTPTTLETTKIGSRRLHRRRLESTAAGWTSVNKKRYIKTIVKVPKESRKDQLAREMAELTRRPPRSYEMYPLLPSMDVADWEATGPEKIDLTAGPPCDDPFGVVAEDLASFSDDVKASLTIPETTLRNASRLYFNQEQLGKRFRPTIVALLGRAIPTTVDRSVRSRQAKLGQITEMIHVASLIHDDLLDDAETRRGGDAVHVVYSNKVAVFTGDYLLARASVLLAQLGDIRVVNTMASALDSLVSGEVMQIKVTRAAAKKRSDDGDERSVLRRIDDGTFWGRLKAFQNLVLKESEGSGNLIQGVVDASKKLALLAVAETASASVGRNRISQKDETREFELYLQKSYFKTASLISDACKSTALLGGYGLESSVATACEEFGFHLGLAFQIIDDVLDFAVDSKDLGKPAGADLSLGLATAPILYATREYPELRTLIDRRFKGPGDVTTAYNIVRASNGLNLARRLALFHAQKAVDALASNVPPSSDRDALISLAYLVLSRAK